MCLRVEKINHSYKYEMINGEKMIPVWKILSESLISPYYSYPWKHGWNISDYDYDRPYLLSENIYHGFHFYLSKKDAIRTVADYYYGGYFGDFMDSARVCKMYIRKEDIIGKGTFHYRKSIVASRAYFPGD